MSNGNIRNGIFCSIMDMGLSSMFSRALMYLDFDRPDSVSNYCGPES